jgi:hypothetical protein
MLFIYDAIVAVSLLSAIASGTAHHWTVVIVAVVIMVVAAVKGQAIKDERKRARKRREMQDYLIEREYKRERRRQSAPWN